MRETKITLPELVLIAGTRAALGAGVGLLLADRLSNEQRRAVGWTLFLFGALSTIPLAFEVFGGHRLSAADGQPEQAPRMLSHTTPVSASKRLNRMSPPSWATAGRIRVSSSSLISATTWAVSPS